MYISEKSRIEVAHLSWVSNRPQVIKLEYSLKLKIKLNDWLLADMCPQAANHCALFLRMNSRFITSRLDL